MRPVTCCTLPWKRAWIDDHISEMLSFPNAKHDDRVDAESQALNYWRGGAEKWPKKCLTFNLRTLILRKTGSIFDMDYSTSYWNRQSNSLNHKRKRFPMWVLRPIKTIEAAPPVLRFMAGTSQKTTFTSFKENNGRTLSIECSDLIPT